MMNKQDCGVVPYAFCVDKVKKCESVVLTRTKCQYFAKGRKLG